MQHELDERGVNGWLANATHEGGPRNGVLTEVTVSASPLASLSFVSTFTVTDLPRITDARSDAVTGATSVLMSGYVDGQAVTGMAFRSATRRAIPTA